MVRARDDDKPAVLTAPSRRRAPRRYGREPPPQPRFSPPALEALLLLGPPAFERLDRDPSATPWRVDGVVRSIVSPRPNPA